MWNSVKDPLTWAVWRMGTITFVKLASLLAQSNCSINGRFEKRALLLEAWDSPKLRSPSSLHSLSPGGVKQMPVIFVMCLFPLKNGTVNSFHVPYSLLCPVINSVLISGVIFEFLDWVAAGSLLHPLITGGTLCNLGVESAHSQLMELAPVAVVLGDGDVSRVLSASTCFCERCLFPALLLICGVSLSKTLHLNQTLQLYDPDGNPCFILPGDPGQIIQVENKTHCVLFSTVVN